MKMATKVVRQQKLSNRDIQKLSNIFSRIAIGTANWGREYNGVKVPDKDIEKILGYCQCSGIDTLDMATAYGNDFSRPNSYFNKIIKVGVGDNVAKIVDEFQPCTIMAHNTRAIRGIVRDISLYDPNYDLSRLSMWPEIVQVPYSLYDRRFEEFMLKWKYPDYDETIKFHARSIFLRGRIIEDGIPAEECIKFVLANPFIDKIIIGADSFDQLRRNLDFIFKWKNLEKHDEALLDPRQW